ncbi:MAG TPA: POTRA domain-containing protein, partial [Parafilimonas sp.]|nr:POTRA domain-containing protein [Parafilimonas sp.]
MAKLNEHTAYAILIFIFCFLFIEGNAQHNCRLIVHPVSNDSSGIISLNLQSVFNDKTTCLQYVNRLPLLLAIKGFITTSVDSVWEDSFSVSTKLFIGKKYEWQKLSINDSNKILLSSLGYNTDNFIKQNFSTAKLEQLYNDVINYYSNNGYPFSTIYLDSISINDNKISAHLNINPGVLYHINSIVVEGNVRLSKFFLERYIQIHEHDIYSEAKLNTINQRLSLLTYIQQSQPWQIEMLNTGAVLHLYLQPTKNNSID